MRCQVVYCWYFLYSNCFFVRTFIAFILLLLFFVSQYARHISYLECRLSNHFNPGNQKCDCEEIAGKTGTGNNFPVPAHHRHLYVEEACFVACVIETPENSYLLKSPGFFSGSEPLCKGPGTSLYQPPDSNSNI